MVERKERKLELPRRGSKAEALVVIHKYHEGCHSGRDCRNPDYMDVFKLAIHGTGYPLPGGYDELLSICV